MAMAEPHVVSALKAKRAELAGEIELTTRQLQRLRAALSSLDATLCLFDPAAVPDAIEPKVWRPKADWAKRGEMTRLCLDVLRRASGPLCNRDIAMALMTMRGMDTDDARLVKLIGKRVGCCLREQRERGAVLSEEGPGQTVMWRLT
jgi:hypothetical protein